MNNNTTMKLALIPIISMSILLLLPFPGSGAAVPTTRQQTILPIAIPDGTPPVAPSNVPLYAVYGYSAWQLGAGTNEGRKFDLMPAGYTGMKNTARLLSFFSMSDIHITDKESPAEVPYLGWSAAFLDDGLGGLNHAAYSPVMFATTYRLDAAVRTINALHQVTPFDFGISLGDDANASQYNELRWFIDVMDGQYITPSSGAHLGATTIDYQMPFQAAGLDHSIPWYDAIGNHDQMWMGIGCPTTPKIQQALVGSNILNISTNGPLLTPGGSEGTGMYVGTVDGTTPYGAVIEWGLTNNFATPPTVAADTNRHSLTIDISSPTNYINEFFNTASLPVGHGFTQAITGSLAACYTFEPVTNMPIKMIVLDDTCKSNVPGQSAAFYGDGWVDAARYTWLTNELQKGQDAGQLMIIACHIPILPQEDLFNTNSASMFYDPQSETNLIATLNRYPNLLMVMAGHRHKNVVTPFPSPDPSHPEYGFWEVETASLRDFPQQFRTWDIRRNSDNSISILTTDVDPQVETNSPAWKSLGYAIGAGRIYGNFALTDTSSHAYNAELVKKLTPAMQAKIAHYGSPLYYDGHDYDGDGKADPAVYREGYWYIYSLVNGMILLNGGALGGPGWTTVSGDYDGDAKADPTVYRDGYWSIYSLTNGIIINNEGPWGGPDSIPVPGDYDGDGKSDLAVYRDGYWSIYSLANGIIINNEGVWGGPGWAPVPGDYDGDGKSDLAVYLDGYWSIYSLASGIIINNEGPWGGPDSIPVPGDYDGDGKSDLAVYLDGYWSIYSLANGIIINNEGVWGGPGWAPVPGDYDGDGKSDLAVYLDGYWSIYSLVNGMIILNGGALGGPDWIPVQ